MSTADISPLAREILATYPTHTPLMLRDIFIRAGYLSGNPPTPQTLEKLLNNQPVRLASLPMAIDLLFAQRRIAWRRELQAEHTQWLNRQLRLADNSNSIY